MKQLYNHKYLFILLSVFALAFTACEEEEQIYTADDLELPSRTALQYVQGAANLSLFYQAVEAAGLTNILSDASSNVTVFAPNNAAFAAWLERMGYNNISEVPQSELQMLLQYHVVPEGALRSSALQSKFYTTALANKPLGVSAGAGGVFLNGEVEVVGANNLGTNGVVHVINDVLDIPAGSLLTTLQSLSTGENPAMDYDLFLYSLSLTNLEDRVSAGGVTLIAPTDEAFYNVGLDSTELEALDVEALTQVIAYHILPQVRFFPDFTSGNLRTLFDEQVAEGMRFPVVVTKGDELAFNNVVVTDANIVATNGVIHAVSDIVDFVLTIAGEISSYSTAREQGAVSSFFNGLQAANYVGRFNNETDKFHVLIPSNLAIGAAFGTTNPWATLTADEAKAIIDRHTFAADLTVNPPATGQRITNIKGEDFFVQKLASGGVTINGNAAPTYGDPSALATFVYPGATSLLRGNVPFANTNLFNGKITTTTHVLNPIPETTLLAQLESEGYTMLVEAIKHAGLEAEFTDNSAMLTVFAPTNEAFQNYLTAAKVAGITDIAPATLKAVLLDHVVPGIYFGRNLARSTQQVFTTSGELPVTVQLLDGKVLYKLPSSVATYEFVALDDALAQGGVIHGVGRVLIQ